MSTSHPAGTSPTRFGGRSDGRSGGWFGGRFGEQRARAVALDTGLILVAALDASYGVDLGRLGTVEVLLAVVAVAALAARRHRPALVLALTLPAAAAFSGTLAALIALSTVAARTRSRALLAAAAAGFLVADTVSWLPGMPAGRRVTDLLATAGYTAALTAAAVFLGRLQQARRDLAARLAEIDRAREHEDRLLAESVLAVERARLAREMHDVVSHQVSLIAVHAGALQVSARHAETREAAGTIRGLSVSTLEELRHLVAVLRRSGSRPTELTPQPTLDDLQRLVDDSGIEAELDGRLPDGTGTAHQRAVYRTVQEALTNIRKHAPGATARITLQHSATELGVTIVNTPATRATDPLPGAGHGLVGLGERAELLGGSLTAGPTPDRGYQVRLTLPVGAGSS